jgi:oligopeptide/dipeptide ABC transporter ATP-binding protein
MVMYAGAAVEMGSVDDIYYRSRMPYTVGLLGAIPRESEERHKLRQIRGTTPSLINMKPGCAFSGRCPLVIDRCRVETPTLNPTDGVDHLSACHRSDDLIGMDTSALFSAEAAQ